MTSRRQFIATATCALAAPAWADELDFTPLHVAVGEHIDKLGIPGGQIAVGRGNRIIFSRALGLADGRKKVEVKTQTLFRIASISKSLTAVAVLGFVEEGALSLDAKMLDVLKPDIFLPVGVSVDPRLKEITIRHLLQHTAGWDRDKSGDPMFQSTQIAKALGIGGPPNTREVVREVLGRPLDSAPGERYVYSNFGYCVLGRILEKVATKPYEEIIKERVLRPAGVTRPQLGSTLTPAEDETRYFMRENDGEARSVFPEQPGRVPWPYGGFCLEMMDAHGGWLATAEDIVRFATSLDDIGGRSPFKKRETYDAMIAPPPGAENDRYYGCGFSIRRRGKGAALSHDGSLPGTSTFFSRRADGTAWAALFNMRDEGGNRDGLIVAAIDKALDEVFRR